MKIKNLIIAAMSALLCAAPALPARTADDLSLEHALAMQAADKELDQFLRAKEAVFERDWPRARKQLEKFLKDFPAGHLRDEALYWLAKSLNGCAAREPSPSSSVALKKEAFGTLERLGREHPGSAWKNDAEEMRIEIAGELVLLGAGEYEGFIREYAASQKADETTLKLAALNSLIRLEPETAFTALASALEKEGDPRIRRRSAALLGQNYAREALAVLGKAAQSDRDAEVREEAAYWTELIRVRLIPADLSYYAVAAQVTGDSARSHLKEGALNRFTITRDPEGLAAARRIISACFGGQVGDFESRAVFERVANKYILRSGQTSHKLHDFRISIVPGSVRKSPGRVMGDIEFIDLVSGERRSGTFSVDAGNDQIFAARRGDKTAVILLHFEPVAASSSDAAEDEDEAAPTGILRFLSRIFGGGSDKKPAYYNLYTSFMGCRVHSTLQSTAPATGNVTDFSLAKAEIPAKGGSQGTWTLTGHIVAFMKERTFVARRASLADPKGKIVAVADEITVAVDDPAGFRVQGSRLEDKEVAGSVRKAEAAAPSAAALRPGAGAREQTCELGNGVKVFYTAPTRIGEEELRGPLVEFGQARIEMPAPDGTWLLAGIVRWISSGGLFLCDKATLTDPRGGVRAKDASILVPMKTPGDFTILDR
jgi:outer membrane protein assembly factor BamD (BamD/ComL family)